MTNISRQVPEDLQSILNDSSLFNNSSEITTKEILKRYGDIGSATHRPTITSAAPADSPPRSSNTAAATPRAGQSCRQREKLAQGE